MYDKDILIIIPINHKISNDFYNKIDNYSNILLLDNNYINKNALPNNKNKFTIMKYNEEWGNYIKNSKYRKFTFINQDTIENDKTSDLFDILLTYLINYLFLSHYKHVFNRLLVFDQDYGKGFLNMPLSGFKSNIDIINYANKNNIDFTITDNIINTNFKTKFNSIKSLLPNILKNLLCYLLNIIIFLILYYLIKYNNILENITVSNFFGGVGGVILFIILYYDPYFHHNHLKKNIVYILINILKICISGYIIYLLYKLIGINIIISKLISDLLLLIGVEILKNKISFIYNLI